MTAMFEDIGYTLQQCGCFLIFGIAAGLCYEPLRILRMLFRHNAALVFVEDLLYFSLVGLAAFITSLWVGIGYFRIYYVVFAFLGACCYFLTLGMLINRIFRKVSKGIKRGICAISQKIKPKIGKLFGTIKQIFRPFFGNIADFLHDKVFTGKKDLPNTDEIVYNNNIPPKNGGENGSVIKAQIRKKA